MGRSQKNGGHGISAFDLKCAGFGVLALASGALMREIVKARTLFERFRGQKPGLRTSGECISHWTILDRHALCVS
jgi:hypothetical protein